LSLDRNRLANEREKSWNAGKKNFFPTANVCFCWTSTKTKQRGSADQLISHLLAWRREEKKKKKTFSAHTSLNNRTQLSMAKLRPK
jgi:hypothetical protein